MDPHEKKRHTSSQRQRILDELAQLAGRQGGVVWDDFDLVVEIVGIHHSWATEVVPDALRQNEVVLGASKVLRLPLLGLRVAADDFFDQVERGLVAGGWRTAA